MPNCKSAEKRIRQAANRNLLNKSRKSRVKTLEKSFMTKVAANDVEGATAAYNQAIGAYDKAVKAGVCHRNKANRKKSRLYATLKGISG